MMTQGAGKKHYSVWKVDLKFVYMFGNNIVGGFWSLKRLKD
jgi:hypothetical protein